MTAVAGIDPARAGRAFDFPCFDGLRAIAVTAAMVGHVGFVSGDFVDLWHCAPSGRAKYQVRLSRLIHTVLDDVGLGSG